MTRHSAAYLAAARSAQALLGEPAVAAGWDGPSALPGMTVGGLAAHVAQQILSVPRALGAARPAAPLVPLREHYERASWRGAGPDAEVNVGIRTAAGERAAAGVEQLRRQVGAAVDELAAALPGESGERPVPVAAGPWALTLDDFLVTRMMEIAVHSDDLAVSVGLPTPDLPLGVLEPVLVLLIGLAVGRHGQPAVLRALARAERAPATINAL